MSISWWQSISSAFGKLVLKRLVEAHGWCGYVLQGFSTPWSYESAKAVGRGRALLCCVVSRGGDAARQCVLDFLLQGGEVWGHSKHEVFCAMDAMDGFESSFG